MFALCVVLTTLVLVVLSRMMLALKCVVCMLIVSIMLLCQMVLPSTVCWQYYGCYSPLSQTAFALQFCRVTTIVIVLSQKVLPSRLFLCGLTCVSAPHVSALK